MPDAPTLSPTMRIDATSYEAAVEAPGLRAAGTSDSARSVPDVELTGLTTIDSPTANSLARSVRPHTAEGPSSNGTAARGRSSSRRVRELMAQLATRRHELWELFRGPFAGSGWGTSVLLHGVALTSLAFLIIAPERPAPSRILTVGTNLEDGPAGVGDSTGDVTVNLPDVATVATDPTLSALGGSTGDTEFDVTGLLGSSAGGRGRGIGGGAGDAIGADIAGRVRAAGGKGGSLQLSLGWNDRSDLDLHLVTPSGERIYYAHIQSADGGRLDVDMNINGESTRPVENITWGGHTPRDGRYLVQVHYFKSYNRNAAAPFHVRLQLGDDVQLIPAVAKEPQTFTQVATFDVQGGRCTAVQAQISEAAGVEIPATAADTKRLENRERTAREALTEAAATADPQLRAGKLRALIRRFGGTEAALEAQQQLDAPPQ